MRQHRPPPIWRIWGSEVSEYSIQRSAPLQVEARFQNAALRFYEKNWHILFCTPTGTLHKKHLNSLQCYLSSCHINAHLDSFCWWSLSSNSVEHNKWQYQIWKKRNLLNKYAHDYNYKNDRKVLVRHGRSIHLPLWLPPWNCKEHILHTYSK